MGTKKDTKKTPAKKPAAKKTVAKKPASEKKDKVLAMPAGEWQSGGIETPKGLYVPETDNLIEELKAAARFAGLSRFKVFVNGVQILKPEDLPTPSVAALPEVAQVAGVDASARVAPYDKAG